MHLKMFKKYRKDNYIYIFIKKIENFRLRASWKKSINEYPRDEETFPLK